MSVVKFQNAQTRILEVVDNFNKLCISGNSDILLTKFLWLKFQNEKPMTGSDVQNISMRW